MAQDKHFHLQCGYLELDLSAPVVMGILNITPDSFYDGGRYQVPEDAIRRAEQMLEEGATILDLGAVSTRPGAVQPSVGEEWERLRPVLEEIRGAFPSVLISIDTYRAEIAQRAADRGANIINDISGGMLDPMMYATIAKHSLAYVCMHMQGTPETMQKNPQYNDVVQDVTTFFAEKTKALHNSGVENVIIDPGFGFGKEVHHNYQLLKHLDSFSRFEKPVLVGVSRKSMITKLLDVNKENALNGTTAVHMVALSKGAQILRVHDVKEAMECIRIHDLSSK
jgi:dihydropteroate synthase